MVGLTISLLGPFAATLDGAPVERFRTRKVQALLIYLAAEAATHRREHLLDLFWPGLPERSARLNLRQILYHLRRALPVDGGAVPYVISDRHTVGLHPESHVEVDVRRFRSLVAKTRRHVHEDRLGCAPCLERLATAVSLYRGEFLPDFYLDDSDRFEEWAEVTRERLRRALQDTLATLTHAALRRQAYHEARERAEHALEVDPLSETATRALMEALARGGERAGALARYETYRRQLADELGMAPTTETTTLYERIAAGERSLWPPPTPAVRGYEIGEEIGGGPEGRVLRARQSAIGRDVAIKLIPARLANDPEFVRRFEAEAQTIAALEHPHVVPIYDYWREPGAAYLVMRLMRGGSLDAVLGRGPIAPVRAHTILAQVGSALASAHRRGVTHRNLKPTNVLLDEAGNAYLTDFGIAREPRRSAPQALPIYASPEALRGEPCTPHSDQYALGLMFYEMLTGERPFADAAPEARLRQQLAQPLPPPSLGRPDVPRDVDRIVRRATAVEPAKRYADVSEMVRALGALFAPELNPPDSAPPLLTGAVPDLPNPYKGLRAFEEADADRFCGRDALIHQLVDRMTETAVARSDPAAGRFLAVVGPSGSGKSSVIKAGLIPALRRGAITGSERWFIAEMTPGARPLEALEAALYSIAINPPPSLIEPLLHDERGLLHLLRRILPPEPDAQLLLVIDQFEELYTLVPDAARRRHVIASLLAALRAPRSPLRVVVALRADFFDRPLGDPFLGTLFSARNQSVPPLVPEELDAAVRGPARALGVTLEPGLVTAIAADVGDQPGALPLMQYALTELFELRTHQTMTQAAYRRIGGLMGAVGQRAEALYAALDEHHKTLARQLFLRLIALQDEAAPTRRRARRSELDALQAGSEMTSPSGNEAQAKDDVQPERGPKIRRREIPAQMLKFSSASDLDDIAPRRASRSEFDAIGSNKHQTGVSSGHDSEVEAVIERFGRARLLTFDFDPARREPTVEVAHEALLVTWPRLRGWIEARRHDLVMQRRVARALAEWLESGRHPDYLLKGLRLDELMTWFDRTDHALTDNERAFLRISRATAAMSLRFEETMASRATLTLEQEAERLRQERGNLRERADVAAELIRQLGQRVSVLHGMLALALAIGGALAVAWLYLVWQLAP